MPAAQPQPSGAAAQPALKPVVTRSHSVQVPPRRSPWKMVLVVIVVIAAGAAYWWFNRPEPDYQLEDSGLYSVVVNGKYGYIDKNGVLTIQPLYDTAGNFQ